MTDGNNEIILNKLLQFSKGYDYACILISNGFADDYGEYEVMGGFGAKKKFESLDTIESETLKFGFISYDYKNRIESLESRNPGIMDLPELFFFEPEYIFLRSRTGSEESNFNCNELPLLSIEVASDFSDLNWTLPDPIDYLSKIEQMREQIHLGDYYEINYCTEWSARGVKDFDPYETFLKLNKLAPAPFACFFKHNGQYLLCSSPERFLKKKNNKLVSQPIKGTRKRVADPHEDNAVKTALITSEKDRAENVMITDLVRNDLSKCCLPGTVEVEALCAIHSFSHVHQMISTISGELIPKSDLKDIIHASFPMGSMTGAPKVTVMDHLEKFENFKRQWYSGTVGFIKDGDFDLNVIIRSLQYNADSHHLAYHVGGAITYDSIATEEYEECLTKASAIRKVLGI